MHHASAHDASARHGIVACDVRSTVVQKSSIWRGAGGGGVAIPGDGDFNR